MKRRKFLSGLVGLTAGGVAIPAIPGAVGTLRPMGKPAYLDRSLGSEMNTLRLALHRGDVPVEVWDDVVSYVSSWRSLESDPESAAHFNRDPHDWLASRNIPANLMDARDVEIRLLQAIYAHPNIGSIATDYRSFARYLESQGIIDPSAPQRLSRRIAEAVRKNRAVVEKALEARGVPKELSFPEGVPLHELEKLISEVNGIAEATNSTLVAVVAIPVAVYVFAAIYISVGTAVVLAITVGFAVTIAVATGVSLATSIYVQGPCEPECTWPEGVPKDGAQALQKLMSLDEGTKNDLLNVTRASYAVGRPDYALSLLREYVETETRTILEVCEAEGLVALPGDGVAREKYLELSSKIAGKMIAPLAAAPSTAAPVEAR